ncbi:MAG: xanthine dehydrogenase family protein subunit M [Planctomycetota bacterium]|nr:xanthine dehydrogenase family protein subunit M [Planctomycetota bacterium]
MNTFDLQKPTSIEGAAALLPTSSDSRQAVLLAGGQDLLGELKDGLVEPERVVNLKGVAGLDAMNWEADGSLTLGALVTLQSLAEEPRVLEEMAVLAEAAQQVGSPQIRSVGTVGGNLNQRPRCWYYRNADSVCLKKGGTHCFAQLGENKYNAILGGGPTYIVHPSDLAPALVALGASAVLVSPRGRRTVLLSEYYLLPADDGITRETIREPDEVLASVHVPVQRQGMRSTYIKFRERGSYDWALSSVALCLWMSDGMTTGARLVLGGVAPTPWRCESSELLLVGHAVDEQTIRRVVDEALRQAEPLSDNAYKVPLTKGLVTRALQTLAS